MPAFGSQRRGCFQLASYTPQLAHSSPRRPFLLSSASGPASSRNSSATRSAISGAKFHARGPATFTAAFSRAGAKRSLCCHSVPSSPRSTPSHPKFLPRSLQLQLDQLECSAVLMVRSPAKKTRSSAECQTQQFIKALEIARRAEEQKKPESQGSVVVACSLVALSLSRSMCWGSICCWRLAEVRAWLIG